MIWEGFRLMAVGMFTVYAFLTLLVGLMKASTAFFERFADQFPEEPARAAAVVRAGNNDAEIALVLAVADATRRGQKV